MFWWSAAGCGDARDDDARDAGADTELCARYKRALLRVQRKEPVDVTPLVNGSYDQYRCPADDSTDALSLAECTRRLEDQCPERGPCDLQVGSFACARGVLIPIRTDLHLPHDGIGDVCSIDVPNSDSGLSFIDGASRDCATRQCLSFQGGPPRCTCQCFSFVDEPVCACPSKFTCRRDLTAGGTERVHEGYCLRASP